MSHVSAVEPELTKMMFTFSGETHLGDHYSASILEERTTADSGTDSERLSASILDDKVRVCSSSCTSRRTG